jgi:hypothetical protein
MKKILSITLLFLFTFSAFAQDGPTSGRILRKDSASYKPGTSARQIISDLSNNLLYWNGSKYLPVPTSTTAGDVFNNPVFPNLQNNATPTTKYWRFVNGTRFFTMRGDTSFLSPTGLTTIEGANYYWGRNAGSLNSSGGGYSVGIGDSALSSLTTGYCNISFGDKSGKLITSGTYNTLIGYQTGSNISSGASNTGLGASALKALTTGTFNVAIGPSALVAGTSAIRNVVVGGSAMFVDSTGSANTSIGGNTLKALRSGNNNVALGYEAGFSALGDGNVFLGYNAGRSETGANKLYIANSSTATPLIGGDFSAGSLDLNITKLSVTAGANKSVGTATLVAGTVTVSNTRVTSSSIIFVSRNTPGGTLGVGFSVPVASIVNGTSFVINAVASNGTVSTGETSTVNWWIIN